MYKRQVEDRPIHLGPVAGVQRKGLDTPGNDVLQVGVIHPCLLYTSDAADDLLCVYLGGRRLIKKKKKKNILKGIIDRLCELVVQL